jgi:hypothetical protein
MNNLSVTRVDIVKIISFLSVKTKKMKMKNSNFPTF